MNLGKPNMSSTDKRTSPDPATQKLLEKFWTGQLVPAAEAVRARNIKFFETHPDATAKSYYTPHKAADSPFTTLEPNEWESKLRALWQQGNLPELANLAGPLMNLASKLKMKDDENADVSPYIYVMF